MNFAFSTWLSQTLTVFTSFLLTEPISWFTGFAVALCCVALVKRLINIR